jgi:hypothetical protein
MAQPHAYRRAALWSAAFTLAAWAAFWLPTKVFHTGGAPPAGYLTSLGFHLLMPGAIVSMFMFGFHILEGTQLVLWNLSLILINWLFYFAVFSAVVRIRHGNRS